MLSHLVRVLAPLFALTLPLWPALAAAQCQGENLLDSLTPEVRAGFEAQTAQKPFSQGNYWTATKGTEEMTVVGTLHLPDARFDAVLAQLAPRLAEAALLLVEAGPEEQAEMVRELGRNPAMIVNMDGPTLPERLTPEEWDAVAAALTARGVPAFMGAKFQPWYVNVVLAMPPCLAQEVAKSGKSMPDGLDQRLMASAEAQGLPIAALEDWRTALAVFSDLPEEDQLVMLTSTVAMEPYAEDFSRTIIEAYFAGQSQLGWEVTADMLTKMPQLSPEEVARELALVEGPLLAARNQAWMAVIDGAAEKIRGADLHGLRRAASAGRAGRAEPVGSGWLDDRAADFAVIGRKAALLVRRGWTIRPLWLSQGYPKE